jgi:hypothetical protein
MEQHSEIPVEQSPTTRIPEYDSCPKNSASEILPFRLSKSFHDLAPNSQREFGISIHEHIRNNSELCKNLSEMYDLETPIEELKERYEAMKQNEIIQKLKLGVRLSAKDIAKRCPELDIEIDFIARVCSHALDVSIYAYTPEAQAANLIISLILALAETESHDFHKLITKYNKSAKDE